MNGRDAIPVAVSSWSLRCATCAPASELRSRCERRLDVQTRVGWGLAIRGVAPLDGAEREVGAGREPATDRSRFSGEEVWAGAVGQCRGARQRRRLPPDAPADPGGVPFASPVTRTMGTHYALYSFGIFYPVVLPAVCGRSCCAVTSSSAAADTASGTASSRPAGSSRRVLQ